MKSLHKRISQCLSILSLHFIAIDAHLYKGSSYITHVIPSFGRHGPKLKSTELIDEFGIKIPPFNLDPEKVKAQVLHYGPNIPGPLWKAPERPVGFMDKKKMAPDVRFIGRDRAVLTRMMRKKYKQIVYRDVRRQYKFYIRNARNTNELIYWKAKLDELPKNSSPSRFKRICMLTGRTRAVYRIVGLTRHKFRELARRGYIPGVMQANW